MTTRRNSPAFQPGSIGNLEIKNRLVRSATFENAATEQGEVTDRLVELHRTLAQGGVGLIVTGIMGVWEKALVPRQVRANDDACISGLKRIANAVHELGNGCKIMAQFNHPGRQAISPQDIPSLASYLPPALLAILQKTGQDPQAGEGEHHAIEPTAPSPVFDPVFQRTPRVLTLDEIDALIDAFAEAIRRVHEAGFDGAQLHAAHGWLLSSFLSPHTNCRDDRYGGSTENRTRMVREIYSRARKMVGPDFPILIKMNTTDYLPGGTDAEEAVRVGKMLAETGFAALETSGGMWEAVTRSEEELGWKPVLLPESQTGLRSKDDEAYFLAGARAMKGAIDAPVILVGGMKSIDTIEKVLAAGSADFVALSRSLIRQPDLPNLWLTGEGPDTCTCISCNACLPVGELPLSCKAGNK